MATVKIFKSPSPFFKEEASLKVVSHFQVGACETAFKLSLLDVLLCRYMRDNSDALYDAARDVGAYDGDRKRAMYGRN